MNKNIEILAPAGSEEALRAAVYAGADAVYFAGKQFGARAAATNFDREALQAAVSFCRARGVKVYITVNTLVKDSEIAEALDFVEFLCSIPADGLIVQDMGLFMLIKACAPEMPLHASTQMSIHSAAGARLVYEAGAARVVLARELRLKEIKEISQNSGIELEAFVHGALCMSVSGQCYFSALLGSRSGNRGMCAQPCRLPFGVSSGTGHDLSLKDLSFIDGIKQLHKSGVCSAKIEGRMKRPEYVAAAVSAAKTAARGEAVTQETTEELAAVFSRSGFTDGYLTGRTGRVMFGTRTKQDVQSADKKTLAKMRTLYRGENRNIPVRLILKQDAGKLCVTAQDEQGHMAKAVLEAEVTLNPMPPERCREQLGKTGNTPFYAAEIEVPDAGVSVAVSMLNALRRQALDELLALRAVKKPVPFTRAAGIAAGKTKGMQAAITEKNGYGSSKDEPGGKLAGLQLRAAFRSIEQLPEDRKGIEKIYLPLSAGPENLLQLNLKPETVILEIPRALFGIEAEESTRSIMKDYVNAGFYDFSCGNLGAVQLCKDAGGVPHGTFGLNIVNTAALEFYRRQGLHSAELSFELTGAELAKIQGAIETGLMIYGRQPLMLTRNCPGANGAQACAGCTGHRQLTDRKGVHFPLMCTGKGISRYTEVFNSVPLSLLDKQREMQRLNFGILRFSTEDPVTCKNIINAYFRQENPLFDYTRGLFKRGIL